MPEQQRQLLGDKRIDVGAWPCFTTHQQCIGWIQRRRQCQRERAIRQGQRLIHSEFDRHAGKWLGIRVQHRA